jgi:CheY-like chemotaxis protein
METNLTRPSRKITSHPMLKSSPTNIRCLVVEDVEENKQVLVEMLNELGCYEIETAENGKKMLDTLTHSDGNSHDAFDVVFVDLLMPVMSGLTAVTEYRKTHRMGRKPFIVAVTATNLLSGEKSSYQTAGFDAFVQKPIKMNELKTLLEVISNA